MYNLTSKLIIYSKPVNGEILFDLAGICRDFDEGNYDKEKMIERIYDDIHSLLDIATKYGFNGNLWHNYLAFLLAMTETPFTLVAEKTGAGDGSVNSFALNDFRIFKQLFDYDFSTIENALGIDCFSVIENFKALSKSERIYNRNVSEKVIALSSLIENASADEELFAAITGFYKENGVGMLGLNKAFRVCEDGDCILSPITNTGDVVFSDLIGYESQKKALTDNTEAFIKGYPANNVLLYGDAGTGKSTSIKAVLNKYYPEGLRMIEIYKHQFKYLSSVISYIKNRNYKFIIYMDDLSFEETELEYKYLKAIIEGGLEIKPDNVLIYATSNRRHLIRETFKDRADADNDDIHRNDTVQEKLSLSARFGIQIGYFRPNKPEFDEIVLSLAGKHPEISLSDSEILARANMWELSHGGRNGRAAKQFIDSLLGGNN